MDEKVVVNESMIDFYLSERTKNNTPFFDEVANAEGTVFPHWLKLAKSFDTLGNEQMDYRAREVAQQLKDNGVTYNIYGDPNGKNRPWRLDPVPMVFGEADWEMIEKGLRQRAVLLNHVLKDIYGERKLIRAGLIPFELVYNHQGFLRQMDKIRIPGEHQLIQYSADLARGPDGKMWVLHDRTDAPSGAGYAFENRVAMTRVFPEMIRENHVRKITSYYQTLKNTLVDLAWQNKENPRIVVLSPGPGNETYFEHAYLSSFMGFTLAVGEDLTVSDGYVWLKTIEGLEKVDVIVRRVDDVFCDPLEFRQDSHLGVVGLMEAIREKKVLVINPLGTRILENPGLMAFLPQLCKHILGEDLILPSVATWWCGQQKEKKYVLENIKFLLIRKIYRHNSNRTVYGGDLSESELDDLIADINTRPYLYVGQEMVKFSTTPSYIDGKLEARNAVFRSYIVSDSDKGTYHVMPGGLSRSSPDRGVFIVSNQNGGISKDTWVLGQERRKVETHKKVRVTQQVENILPSRTGENLFWLGRHIERSIYTVRLLRIIIRKFYETDDETNVENDITLVPLLKALTAITGTQPGFFKRKTLQNPEKELISLMNDTKRLGTLSQSLQAFISNGYAVRDRLSLDTWRILESISEEWEHMQSKTSVSDINRNLDNLIIKLMAFHGLNIDNMTREPSWYILNIGRFLESSMQTCAILKNILSAKHDTETEKTLLEFVLMANESLVTYRYRYRSTLEIYGVLSLLLIDELNPKSVVYQIENINYHVESMPTGKERYLNPIRKKLLEITTLVRLCDPQHLATIPEKEKSRVELRDLLGNVMQGLSEASNIINEHYFSHIQSQYSFVTTEIPEV
ncbi:circularly permuted type 2 ATP-grasp protein [Chondrinema litorale]|uniref:circularly permuted type 2 ATP-grasp protein n=1 Tax=Chondrinema litorale TaxID=2994555 RepID=UPI002542847D|nr:circularly permuted type 2 ATP-grasp protein [Chondrinema litorale]UZR96125.1 circularly permuted type 2 ATP-grasp protein [Chondrinema litorale]